MANEVFGKPARLWRMALHLIFKTTIFSATEYTDAHAANKNYSGIVLDFNKVDQKQNLSSPAL